MFNYFPKYLCKVKIFCLFAYFLVVNMTFIASKTHVATHSCDVTQRNMRYFDHIQVISVQSYGLRSRYMFLNIRFPSLGPFCPKSGMPTPLGKKIHLYCRQHAVKSELKVSLRFGRPVLLAILNALRVRHKGDAIFDMNSFGR